jgi:AcrR family transcriptional regulator
LTCQVQAEAPEKWPVALTRRDEIVRAAIACFLRDGVENASLASIATEAEMARSSLYREFSNTDELLRYLHDLTLLFVEAAVARRVRGAQSVGYRGLVQAGARGLFEGLSYSPWTGEYLVSQPGKAMAYVLLPDEGGLIDRFGRYCGACGERVGGREAGPAGIKLVTTLLTVACLELTTTGTWPGDLPQWPTWIDTAVDTFLATTGIDPDHKGPIESVPMPPTPPLVRLAGLFVPARAVSDGVVDDEMGEPAVATG